MTAIEGQHPKLVAALTSAQQGDYGPIIGVTLSARTKQDEGRYCECTDPIIAGSGLMCGRCLLNNRDQEVKAVLRIVSPHDFVPSERFEAMCDVCTNWEDAPRHHGLPGVGRTSWGTDVRP